MRKPGIGVTDKIRNAFMVSMPTQNAVGMAPKPWRAFAHRNFRLYILGQGASVIGSWMQQVAMAWLVYELTGSPLWLGLVAFAGQIPALF